MRFQNLKVKEKIHKAFKEKIIQMKNLPRKVPNQTYIIHQLEHNGANSKEKILSILNCMRTKDILSA